MNEEMIQAARAAFKQNPEAACKAILGCTPEELFCEAVKAARGCNQHGHKPGCPDAEGGRWNDKTAADKLKSAIEAQKKAKERAEKNYSEENRNALNAANKRVNKYKKQIKYAEGNTATSNKKGNATVYYLYNNKNGRMEAIAEEEMLDFVDQGLTNATISKNKNGLTIDTGVDKRTLKFGQSKNEKAKQREFIAKAFGSFDYTRNGKKAYDDDALDRILDMVDDNQSVSLAVFGDWDEYGD